MSIPEVNCQPCCPLPCRSTAFTTGQCGAESTPVWRSARAGACGKYGGQCCATHLRVCLGRWACPQIPPSKESWALKGARQGKYLQLRHHRKRRLPVVTQGCVPHRDGDRTCPVPTQCSCANTKPSSFSQSLPTGQFLCLWTAFRSELPPALSALLPHLTARFRPGWCRGCVFRL